MAPMALSIPQTQDRLSLLRRQLDEQAAGKAPTSITSRVPTTIAPKPAPSPTPRLAQPAAPIAKPVGTVQSPIRPITGPATTAPPVPQPARPPPAPAMPPPPAGGGSTSSGFGMRVTGREYVEPKPQGVPGIPAITGPAGTRSPAPASPVGTAPQTPVGPGGTPITTPTGTLPGAQPGGQVGAPVSGTPSPTGGTNAWEMITGPTGGGKGPVEAPRPLEALEEDFIRSLLEGVNNVNTDEEEALIRAEMDRLMGQGLVNSRARAGYAGMESSGMQLAAEGGIRRDAANDVAGRILDTRGKAKQQAIDNAFGGIGADVDLMTAAQDAELFDMIMGLLGQDGLGGEGAPSPGSGQGGGGKTGVEQIKETVEDMGDEDVDAVRGGGDVTLGNQLSPRGWLPDETKASTASAPEGDVADLSRQLTGRPPEGSTFVQKASDGSNIYRTRQGEYVRVYNDTTRGGR